MAAKGANVPFVRGCTHTDKLLSKLLIQAFSSSFLKILHLRLFPSERRFCFCWVGKSGQKNTSDTAARMTHIHPHASAVKRGSDLLCELDNCGRSNTNARQEKARTGKNTTKNDTRRRVDRYGTLRRHV